MADQNGSVDWVPKLGDRVKLRDVVPLTGRIIELRGGLGPGGVDIFGIELENYSRSYTEVRGDQLAFLGDDVPAAQPVPSVWE